MLARYSCMYNKGNFLNGLFLGAGLWMNHPVGSQFIVTNWTLIPKLAMLALSVRYKPLNNN